MTTKTVRDAEALEDIDSLHGEVQEVVDAVGSTPTIEDAITVTEMTLDYLVLLVASQGALMNVVARSGFGIDASQDDAEILRAELVAIHADASRDFIQYVGDIRVVREVLVTYRQADATTPVDGPEWVAAVETAHEVIRYIRANAEFLAKATVEEVA